MQSSPRTFFVSWSWSTHRGGRSSQITQSPRHCCHINSNSSFVRPYLFLMTYLFFLFHGLGCCGVVISCLSNQQFHLRRDLFIRLSGSLAVFLLVNLSFIPCIRAQNESLLEPPSGCGALRLASFSRLYDSRPLAFKPPSGFWPSLRVHALVLSFRIMSVIMQTQVASVAVPQAPAPSQPLLSSCPAVGRLAAVRHPPPPLPCHREGVAREAAREGAEAVAG